MGFFNPERRLARSFCFCGFFRRLKIASSRALEMQVILNLMSRTVDGEAATLTVLMSD
jgi:hypothetical protein